MIDVLFTRPNVHSYYSTYAQIKNIFTKVLAICLLVAIIGGEERRKVMDFQIENLLNRFNRCSDNNVTAAEVEASVKRLGKPIVDLSAHQIFDDIMSHRK